MRAPFLFCLAAAVFPFSLGCDAGPSAPLAPTEDASLPEAAAPPAPGDDAAVPLDAGASLDAASPPPSQTDGGTPAAADSGGPIQGWPSDAAAAVAPPDFGPNVLIFDPSMSQTDIQSQLDTVSTAQNAPTPQTPDGYGCGAEYSTSRWALLFKPGQYSADKNLGFYVQALGLRRSPTT